MRHVYMNTDWKPFTDGGNYNGRWIKIGVFESEAEANGALLLALDKRYPHQWSYEGQQFKHRRGGPGDQVVGLILPYDMIEQLRGEIALAEQEGDTLGVRTCRQLLAQYE